MPILTDFTNSQWRLKILEDRISNPDPALYEMAEVLREDLEANAPEEQYLGGTLKEIATRQRGPFNTAEGRAIGIGDATRVVPANVAAPSGTITEFLKERDELGRRPPPDKSWAWWYLNRRQKQALKEGRMEGKYGGMPGMAPYLWIQEYGKASAHVKPQLFLEKAIANLRAMIPAIIKRHIHAG